MDSGYLDIGLLVYKKELESDTPKWIFGGGADSAPPRSPREFNMPDLIGLRLIAAHAQTGNGIITMWTSFLLFLSVVNRPSKE